MKKPIEIPVIEVKGEARERGRQQGEGAREQIRSMINAYRFFCTESDDNRWTKASEMANRYLPHALSFFPDMIEELKGISEGAVVSFDDVWLLNCWEEVFSDFRIASCSNLAVGSNQTGNNHVLLAHNEDWLSVDSNHIYILRTQPLDSPAFISVSYGALLANIGFNEHGIGVAINSVYHQDFNISVPRIVYSRAVLSARTIDEAVNSCIFENRSGGYNFTLAGAEGDLYCVECSAAEYELISGDKGWIAHTNHYQSANLQKLEKPGAYNGSHERLKRIKNLLLQRLGKVNIEDLQLILRDHENWPDSICSHDDQNEPVWERSQTIVSIIVDLTDQKIMVAAGPPCVNEYVIHEI